MTPKPPQRGMYAALRAKEEIVHPASFRHPSAFSVLLSLYAVCCRLCSFRFLHKFSFVSAVSVSATPATSAAPPGVLSSLSSVPAPLVPHSAGRKSVPKSHLALLRMTPKPPQRGMSAAPKAKKEIVLSVRCASSASIHHKFSFVSAVWVAATPATAAHQPPLRSARRSNGAGVLMLFFAGLKKHHPLILPACPTFALRGAPRKFGSSALPTPEARLIRTAHASPVADSLRSISRPGRSSFEGLRPTLRGMEPSAAPRRQFRRYA